ncbi:chemotaxis protein chec -- inhibitor of mcp methylation [hydrocarbon metagenome]|uniref:Chemotaxis protein chec--inhibitor of mcp methylation n=1 Tax=hydrocarbon metagenome TaxID=938273 RepID=A0A0W8G5V5_9ZZZZ
MQLTPMQLDILQELINIGVGRAAGMLNRMVSTHIQLQVPELVVLSSSEFITRYGTRGQEVFSAVQLTFSGHFSGLSALIFPPESASRLVGIILGNSVLSEDEAEAMRVETLQEVGNIVLNGVMGSIGNILKENIVFSTPDYVEERFERLVFFGESADSGAMVLMARTQFTIKDHLIEGEVLILFSLASFGTLLAAIDALAAS